MVRKWRGLSVPVKRLGAVKLTLFRALDSAFAGSGVFIYATPSRRFNSLTGQAKRPLIRTGRNGPFSRQAHALKVWGRRVSR